MHNGGDADVVRLEAEENGWELVVESNFGRYRFNVHGIASSGELDDQLEQCKVDLAGWRIEGRMAARAHEVDLAIQAADEMHDRLVGDV